MKITINCSVCSQKLKVPLTFKKLRITCPKCYSQFYYQIKLPDFISKIKNWFSKINFTKNLKKDGYTNYSHTDIPTSDNVKKIFVVWITVILMMLAGAVILTYLNKKSFNKRLYEKYKYQIEQQQESNDKNNMTENKDDIYL